MLQSILYHIYSLFKNWKFHLIISLSRGKGDRKEEQGLQDQLELVSQANQ